MVRKYGSKKSNGHVRLIRPFKQIQIILYIPHIPFSFSSIIYLQIDHQSIYYSRDMAE